MIENNVRFQCRYTKSVIGTSQKEKPKNIARSNEIQERIERRGIKLENRAKGTKSFTRNKTIIEIAVEYAEEIEETCKIIALIN